MRTAIVCAILVILGLSSQSPEIPPLSASTTIGLPASPEAVPIPEGVQVFYHWDDVPTVAFGPGFHRKVVIGETVSVSWNELDPRHVKALFADANAPPHHHTFEQIAFGLRGSLEWLVGGRKKLSGPREIVVAGPDVPHGLSRIPGTDKVVNIEFAVARRTTRRRPCPAHRLPATTTTSSKSSTSSKATPWMRIGDQIEKVSPGTIAVVPPNVDHLSMSPIDDEEVVLLDFQPVVRRDLRAQMEKATSEDTR